MENTIKSSLSQRVIQMEESATIKMAQMARDFGAKGIDVINLSLGEPDFDTPDHIKEAAKKALDEGYTKYTPVPGRNELREAIQAKFKRDNNLEFDLDQIVVSNGAKQTIANLSLALLNRGDEAIILTPYWVSYYEIIRLGEGTPVLLSAGIEDNYKISPEQLEAALNERTKLLIFSSPCNPTGSVYSAAELKVMAEVLAKYPDVYVISDEIYEYINFLDHHTSIGIFEEVKDRTITVNGFSKGFAMTGWRLGYMGAPKEVAKACAKIQGQFTSGAASFSQRAAALALNSDLGPTLEMKKAYLKRRDLVRGLLEEIPGMKVNNPEGAFYIFPDISAFFGKSYGDYIIKDSVDFCEYVLGEGHVAVVPGKAFGAEECFRISYAASEKELTEALSRIKEALGKL